MKPRHARAISKPHARCLIAVEVEYSGIEKHFLGDIVNASALGRVGFLRGANNAALRTFLRLLKYLGFLIGVRKPAFDLRNILVLSADQLENVLGELSSSPRGTE